jgi:hypothetical protein
MAGVKVTDLPVLSAADLADIFYVVDASGVQSKQVDLATIAAALSTALPFIHLDGTTTGGQGNVTGVVDFDAGGTKGARIVFTYPNGNVISFGGEFNDGTADYSTITFFNASVSETLELYLRGGDLILKNVDTGLSTSPILQSFITFRDQRVIYSIDSNSLIGNPQSSTNAGQQINFWNGRSYISNGLNGNLNKKCWTPLPQYYFIDSCSYTQVGTSAPTEDFVFESLIGSVGGQITKAITYQSVGHYHITYTFPFDPLSYQPLPQKVKVMALNGSPNTGVHISAQVAATSVTTIQVSIFTRGNSGAANGLLQGAFIDVYFYV